MFGYGEGWQESEYNNRTGLTWRWTSDRADLRIVRRAQRRSHAARRVTAEIFRVAPDRADPCRRSGAGRVPPDA